MTVPVAGPAAVGLPAWAGRPAAFVGGVHLPPPRALSRAPCVGGGGVGAGGGGGGAGVGGSGHGGALRGACRRRVAMAAAVAAAVVPCGIGGSAFGGARLGATGRRQPHGGGTERLGGARGRPWQLPLQRQSRVGVGGSGGGDGGRSASGAAGATAVFVWSSDNFFSDGPGDEDSSVGGSGSTGPEPGGEGESGDVFPLGEGSSGDCGEGVLQAGTHHMGIGGVGATGGSALGSGMLDCIFMVEEEANGQTPLRFSWLDGDSGLGLGGDDRRQVDFGPVPEFLEYTPLDTGRGADARGRGADADPGSTSAYDSDGNEVSRFDSDDESDDDSDDDEDEEDATVLYVLDDDSDDEDEADGAGNEDDSDDEDDDEEDDVDLHNEVTLMDVNFDDADFALALCDVPSFLGLQFDESDEDEDVDDEEDDGEDGHSLLADVDMSGVVGFGPYHINDMLDRHLEADSLQAVDLSLVSELAAARLSPACVRSEKVLYEVIAHHTPETFEVLSRDVSPAGLAAIRHAIVSRYGDAAADHAPLVGIDGAGVLAAAVAAAATESSAASAPLLARSTTTANGATSEAIMQMSASELNQAIYTALAAGYLLRGSEYRYLLSRTLDAPPAVGAAGDSGPSSVRGSVGARGSSAAVPPATVAVPPAAAAVRPGSSPTPAATPGGPLLGWLKSLDPSSAGGMAVELTPAAAGAFRRVVASLTGDVPATRLAVRAAYRLPRGLLAALTLWASMLGYVTHTKDSRLHVEETWRRALGGGGGRGAGVGEADVDDRGPPPVGTDRAGG